MESHNRRSFFLFDDSFGEIIQMKHDVVTPPANINWCAKKFVNLCAIADLFELMDVTDLCFWPSKKVIFVCKVSFHSKSDIVYFYNGFVLAISHRNERDTVNFKIRHKRHCSEFHIYIAHSCFIICRHLFHNSSFINSKDVGVCRL